MPAQLAPVLTMLRFFEPDLVGGQLRFGDADGVLQMRRPIGQRGLDRQPIDAGAEQRLPEIALEAVLQEIGRAHAARGQRLLSSTTATSLRPSRVALATKLNPELQMNPVFMPSAPGRLNNRPLCVRKICLPT